MKRCTVEKDATLQQGKPTIRQVEPKEDMVAAALKPLAQTLFSRDADHPADLLPQSPVYRTDLGAAYAGDALRVLKALPDQSVNAVITSPPHALHFKKEYGNADKQSYVRWMLPFGAEIKRVLK